MGRNYCTKCDDYGHAAEDHREIRNALFDYMTCLQLETQFEDKEEEDGMG